MDSWMLTYVRSVVATVATSFVTKILKYDLLPPMKKRYERLPPVVWSFYLQWWIVYQLTLELFSPLTHTKSFSRYGLWRTLELGLECLCRHLHVQWRNPEKVATDQRDIFTAGVNRSALIPTW